MLQIAFFALSVVARDVDNSQRFLGHEGVHVPRETSKASLLEESSGLSVTSQECDEQGCATHDNDCCVHRSVNEGQPEKCRNGARGQLLTFRKIPEGTSCHKYRHSHSFSCCPKSVPAKNQEYCDKYATTAQNCQYDHVRKSCKEECEKFEAVRDQHQEYCDTNATADNCKNYQHVRDFCIEECEKFLK